MHFPYKRIKGTRHATRGALVSKEKLIRKRICHRQLGKKYLPSTGKKGSEKEFLEPIGEEVEVEEPATPKEQPPHAQEPSLALIVPYKQPTHLKLHRS